MKKFALILLLLIAGCRTGKEDPLLSLRSRDARITGTWQLKSAQINMFYYFQNGTSYVKDFVFSGTNLKIISGTHSENYSYGLKIKIDKDGKFERYENADEEFYSCQGYWFWKNNRQNKVAVEFTCQLSDIFRISNIFEVKRLTNSELKLSFEFSKGYSSVDDSVSASGYGEMFFVKQN